MVESKLTGGASLRPLQKKLSPSPSPRVVTALPPDKARMSITAIHSADNILAAIVPHVSP